jgi:hypothetical protein
MVSTALDTQPATQALSTFGQQIPPVVIPASVKFDADSLKGVAGVKASPLPTVELPVTPKVDVAGVKVSPLPTVELPVTPKVDVAGVKASPLPAVDLPVIPKINVAGLKASPLPAIDLPVTTRIQAVAGDSMAERMKQLVPDKPIAVKATIDLGTAKADLAKLTTTPVVQKFSADTKQATVDIEDVRARAEALKDKSVTIDAKNDKALTAIRDVIGQANKLVDKYFDVFADTSAANTNLLSLKDLYDKFVSKTITLTVNTKTNDIPGRAVGGPVTAGQVYMVGERRPELFVPDVSGYIVPYVPSAITQQVSGVTGSESQRPRTVINHNETYVLQDSLATNVVMEQQRLQRIAETQAAM